ncbi:MAG: hypothetical protein ACD_10C00325G0001 [uncultured bacterium]|nr:MAG: hypothetical protein ACD_10C00325G0001 [uncultured bacterium]
MGIFSRQAQATVNGGVIVSIADHKTQHIFRVDRSIFGVISVFEAVQCDNGMPVLIRRIQRLRHQRHLPGDIEQTS